MAATLTIRAVWDATRAQAGMRDTQSSASRMGSKVTDTLKGVAAGFAAGFGAEKLVDGVKESITAASDLSETMSKTHQIFGSSADAITAWSKDSSNALGLSQTAALDAADTFAIFGKSAGLTGGDLTGFSESLVGTSADFASFANTTPENAIEAIGAALRGETEPIRKYGLMLNDASIKNEAMRMGLIKTTKVPIDPSKRALAVKSLIDQFAKGQKITGDFARTSGGLANQQRILAAKITNAKAALGTQLLPIVLKGEAALQAFGGWVQKNSDWLKPLAAVVGIVAAAVGVAAVATWAWGAAVAFLASPIYLIIAAIALLVAGVIYAYQRFAWFRSAVQAIWGGIKAYIGVQIAIIRAYIMMWVAVIKVIIAAARAMWSAMRTVWAGVSSAIRSAVTAIRTGLNGLISFVRGIPGRVRSALASIAGIIRAPFVAAWSWVKTNIIGRIGAAFAAVPHRIASALSGVFHAITAPFSAAWSWVKSHVIDPISHGVSTITKGLSGIKSTYNSFARTWNGIEVHVAGKKLPGPIPDIPGFTFGLPDLPYLARGAYVSRATAAIVGEGGPEFVAPERMLRRVIREEGGGGVYITINGALDPDAVARQIESILTRRARRTGGVQRRGVPVTA